MKRLAAIIAIIALLFNSMGYFVVFKAVQYSVKNEIRSLIKNRIPEKELDLIMVVGNDAAKQLRMEWLDDNEFRLDGKLYDVVRRYVQNDTTFYYCINDRNEEQLFAHLDEMVKHQSENSPVPGQKSEKLVKNIIREAIPEIAGITRPFCCEANLISATLFLLVTNIQEVPSPPPKS